MARAPRVPPSEPGFTRYTLQTPVREAFFTDETNWRDFHKRWREIDAMLPLMFDGSGTDDVIVGLRATARADLRRDVRQARAIGPRIYLVPV